jgi:hypothetical protein
VTDETELQQEAEDTTNAAQQCPQGHTLEARGGVERTRRGFNRYLYDNLVSNVDLQIEYWNRKADSQENPAAGQALRLKAEGLGYALRLLNAFEPEFQELVDCASRTTTDS